MDRSYGQLTALAEQMDGSYEPDLTRVVQLLDPVSLAAQLESHGYSASAFTGKANSFTCPCGETPGIAWLLVRRADLETLIGHDPDAPPDKDIAYFNLTLGHGTDGQTFRRLVLRRATRVLPGVLGQSQAVDAPYLLELNDCRAVAIGLEYVYRHFNSRVRDPISDPPREPFEETWGSGSGALFPLSCASGSGETTYGALSGASGSGRYLDYYYSGSRISSAEFGGCGGTNVWSWYSIVKFLWPLCIEPLTDQEFSAALWPSPADSQITSWPENLIYRGESAFHVLCDVLRHVGMILRYDPIAHEFSIFSVLSTVDESSLFDARVKPDGGGAGIGQAPVDVLERSATDALINDGEAFSAHHLVLPRTIQVRQPQFPEGGSASDFYTLSQDSGQAGGLYKLREIDAADSLYDVPASVELSELITVRIDEPTSYTADGRHSNRRALEVASSYWAVRAQQACQRRVYLGCLKAVASRQVSQVVWQDLGGGAHTILSGEPYAIERRIKRYKHVLSGGSSCPPKNAKWEIAVFGKPTGGTFDLTLFTDKTVTLDYNVGANAVEDAFDVHEGSLGVDPISVTGGPLPNRSLYIEAVNNQSEQSQPEPFVDWDGLSGGTGVGVLVNIVQVGSDGG